MDRISWTIDIDTTTIEKFIHMAIIYDFTLYRFAGVGNNPRRMLEEHEKCLQITGLRVAICTIFERFYKNKL